MNVLVTASIGLCLWENKYYLQIIPAETQESYFIHIGRDQAQQFLINSDLEIATDINPLDHAN